MTTIKIWLMNVLEPWIPSLFLRGAAMALIAILLLVLFFWIISLLFYLRNGKHRCSQVIVPLAGGDAAISGAAITDAIRDELQGYAQLQIRKIHLYRRRKNYMVEICCAFRSSADRGGLPELTGMIKPKLTEKIQALFGIKNLSEISFAVVEYRNDGEQDASR